MNTELYVLWLIMYEENPHSHIEADCKRQLFTGLMKEKNKYVRAG